MELKWKRGRRVRFIVTFCLRLDQANLTRTGITKFTVLMQDAVTTYACTMSRTQRPIRNHHRRRRRRRQHRHHQRRRCRANSSGAQALQSFFATCAVVSCCLLPQCVGRSNAALFEYAAFGCQRMFSHGLLLPSSSLQAEWTRAPGPTATRLSKHAREGWTVKEQRPLPSETPPLSAETLKAAGAAAPVKTTRQATSRMPRSSAS